MWNLKYGTNELIYKTEADSQMQRSDVWLPRGWGREREFGVGSVQFSSVTQSCPTLVTPQAAARQAPLSREFPGKNTGVGWHFLLQGIFPTQRSNPGLPHCSVQFSSVVQSCPTLCDPMNHSTPGLPVHRQLPEFTQTHVHRVSDAIQPSHPLSSPSPLAPNPSQHQGLFQ